MSTRKCLYKLPLNLSVGVWGKNHILVLRDSHVVAKKSPNEIISFNKIHLLVLSNVCLAMWGKQRLDWEYILSSDNVPTPVPVICTTQAATQSLHSFSLFCCTYMRTYVSAGQKQKSPPNCYLTLYPVLTNRYSISTKLSKVCLSARKLQTPKIVQLLLGGQISVIPSLEVVVVRVSAYLRWYVRCKTARDQVLKVTTRQDLKTNTATSVPHKHPCKEAESVDGCLDGDSTQAELSNCYELSSSHNIEPASANVFAKLLQKDNCWSKQDTTDSRKLLSPFSFLCHLIFATNFLEDSW